MRQGENETGNEQGLSAESYYWSAILKRQEAMILGNMSGPCSEMTLQLHHWFNIAGAEQLLSYQVEHLESDRLSSFELVEASAPTLI